MNRNIKTLTKILIILLMIISTLFILPKATFALEEISDHDLEIRSKGNAGDPNNKTLEQLKQGGIIYLGGGAWQKKNNILCSSRVYCIHSGTHLNANCSYKIMYEYDVYDDCIEIIGYGNYAVNSRKVTNPLDVNFAKGIISILSHAENNRWDYTEEYGYYDEIQAALWAYLYDCKSSFGGYGDKGYSALEIKKQGEGTKVYDDPNHDYVKNFGNCIELTPIGGDFNGIHISNSNESLAHRWVDGFVVSNSKAYEWYKEAKDIFDGISEKYRDKKFSGKIYKLQNVNTPGQADGAAQEILIAQKAKITETPDIVPVTLNLKKQNFNNQALSGATIKFTNVENANAINGKSYTSKSDGTISVTFTPTQNTGSFKVKIEETTVPSGYIGFKGAITLTVKYDTSTGAVTSITSDNQTYVPNGSSSAVIKNSSVIKLKFKKIDIYGNAISGAAIKVTKGDNVSEILGLTSKDCLIANLTTGEYNSITVIPTDPTRPFVLNISEVNAPAGLAGFETKTLRVNYDTKTGTVRSILVRGSDSKVESSMTYSDGKINIKNSPKIPKLELIKTDALTGSKLANATFRITITGVDSIKGYSVPTNGKKVIDPITTNSSGTITLNDLVFNEQNNKQITIRVEETKTPPTDDSYYYKKIDPIEFTISYSVVNGKATFKLVNAPACVELKGYTVTLNIENQQYMKLSGRVWLDGQQGSKVAEGPNGIMDGKENGVEGVLVELCRPGTNERINSIEPIWTDGEGKYEFTDVPMTKEGYYVRFSYDGINYIATQELVNYKGTGRISKAFETVSDRNSFNNKFKSIIGEESTSGGVGNKSRGTAISADGKSKIPLSYNCNGNNKCIASLEADMDGRNPAQASYKSGPNYPYIAADFRMMSKSRYNYKETTENIDFGLVKKELDLTIRTDVESARVEINDKSITYNYNQVVDGDMNDIDFNESSNDNKSYNYYLYESDYYYRIADYKTDVEGGIENKVNPEDSKTDAYMNLKELEAYVTYKIKLENETTTEAYVDDFVYYYDAEYTPVSVNGISLDELESVDGYTVTVDNEARIIRFRAEKGKGAPLNKESSYLKEILIEFRVNKNADGYIELKNNCSNVAEITGYTSREGGFIDVDSAPGNAGVRFNNVGTPEVSKHYEDDTEKSSGLNILIKPKAEREIRGTVFEDTDGDGKLNDENGPVNDVIVQLIEILPVESDLDGQIYNCEYIWQETRSGSKTVKKLSIDGNTIKETQYSDDVEVGDGEFVFRDFIPGDYIVRYIYGDGSTEDVKTYNGQDYKSTNDPHYNEKEFYNELMNVYGENSSVARDNELRRLEVMSYSPIIDKEIGSSLVEKTSKDENDKTGLDYTWMAAETSKINVPIDVENEADLQKTDNERTVAYENISENNIIVFNGMNFGLTLRPETSITLEKHITGLKITPNGVGAQPIVDATADIERILDVDVLSEGVVTGLATNKSTRGSRGFWQVATDVEELMQGAQLEVEYTYVVTNDGDVDYLPSRLINEYKNNLGGYSDLLLNIVKEIKGEKKGELNRLNGLKGKTNEYGNYLGQFYYTGIVGNGELPVPTRIEADGLEEAINNDLAFENGEFFKKVNSEAVGKTVYNTDGDGSTENMQTVIHNINATESLEPGERDFSNKVTLKTVLASTNGGELGANIPSYIAEVIKYSNAAGRRDMEAQPANLSYVHSNDNRITVGNSNEEDEFWGESIIITKPTGEDKISTMQIAIIAVTAVAVLGVGIILIKKFALKK